MSRETCRKPKGAKGIKKPAGRSNIDEDTYYTISYSFEEFLAKMDEELK